MTPRDPLDTRPTAHDTHEAIAAGRIERYDECSQCGDRLIDVAPWRFWATDAGRYCSVRCAETHTAFLVDAREGDRP
jgi:hypothetical protein